MHAKTREKIIMVKVTHKEACETLLYKVGTEKVTKPKKKYKTDKEAIEQAKNINSKGKILHKAIAYKCPKCGFYHVGKSKKLIQ